MQSNDIREELWLYYRFGGESNLKTRLGIAAFASQAFPKVEDADNMYDFGAMIHFRVKGLNYQY